MGDMTPADNIHGNPLCAACFGPILQVDWWETWLYPTRSGILAAAHITCVWTLRARIEGTQ